MRKRGVQITEKTKAQEIMEKKGMGKTHLAQARPEYSIEAQKQELAVLLDKLEERKKKYSITSSTLDKIPQQKQLLQQMIEEGDKEVDERVRYTLYYGGNGAGKSFCWAYVTVLKALGRQTKKYSLPYIGSKKVLWVVTKSGSNVKSTIEPYLIGEGSPTRIPPDEILRINKDNGILKGIDLVNGSRIIINTYDQGAEALQGLNPDWIWLDEEPRDEDVVNEIFVRTRKKECEMLVTMTPLSGLTPIYEWFINQKSEIVKKKSRIYIVSSMDNPFTDKTWAEGLTEEQYRLRVMGSFESPTGLVYSSFHRRNNVVPHYEPELMDSDGGSNLKFYKSIDFGTSHPTAVVFVAQDLDDNLYVYDEIYKSNTLLRDIAEEIIKKSKKRQFVYTLYDKAAKREATELAELGIKAIPADKSSKGENDMSNRRAWIMLVNQLFADKKLFISSECVNLIKELESHYYKEGGKRDGEVNKVNDDLLDALRYLVFNIKKNNRGSHTFLEKRITKVKNEIGWGGKFCNF